MNCLLLAFDENVQYVHVIILADENDNECMKIRITGSLRETVFPPVRARTVSDISSNEGVMHSKTTQCAHTTRVIHAALI